MSYCWEYWQRKEAIDKDNQPASLDQMTKDPFLKTEHIDSV